MRKQSNDSLKRFIREELGCQCPGAVFRDIGIELCPPTFGDWPKGWLVSVGQRLLILILDTDVCVVNERRLQSLFEAGRRMRDASGFNRFRLVVATSRPDAIASSLIPGFETLEGRDDRLHLHVIASDRVTQLRLEQASNGRTE